MDKLEKEIAKKCKQKKFSVPLKDYQTIIKELYKYRIENIQKSEQNQQKQNPEAILTKFVNMQEQLKKFEDENHYLKKTIDTMIKENDRLNQKIEDLILQNNTIAGQYKNIIENKDRLEDRLLNLNKEKERAENTLIEKAMMFAKLQDEVMLEKEKLNKEKLKMKQDIKEINLLKLKLKSNNQNQHKRFSFDNIQPKQDIDDFIEIKTKMKKFLTLPQYVNTENKKNYYNLIAMNFNNTQKILATCGMNKEIIISDLSKNLKQICVMQGKSTINNLCFTEKQNFLCTANSDNDIDIIDIKKQKVVFKFKNHQDQVIDVKSTEENNLVSASQDRTIKIFDLNSYSLKDSILQSSTVMSMSVNNNVIYSGHYNGQLRVHSIKTRNSLFQENLFPDGQIHFCDFIQTTNQVFLAGLNKNFKIFDLRMMKVMKSFQLENTNIFDGKQLSYGIDSNLSKIYFGTNDGHILHYDIFQETPTLVEDFKVNNTTSAIPYVLLANFHESIICSDFEGFVYQIKIVNEFQQI